MIYYRLIFTFVTDSKKRKKWIGAEHKSKKVLKQIGNNIAKDGKTKFYITKIVETRV